MEEHRKEHMLFLHVFHTEKRLEESQVSRTGDGQKFSDTLDEPHQDGHQIRHAVPSTVSE